MKQCQWKHHNYDKNRDTTMRSNKKVFSTCLAIVGLIIAIAQARALDLIEIEVQGAVRKAEPQISQNVNEGLLPVVFAFHGHGGTMKTAEARFHIETYWPEAIVVYPQGLKTPTKLVDPDGKKSGWQSTVNDQAGRDIEFFDSLLNYLEKNYAVNRRRIYSTGFSNGGVFTYVLWAARGNILAAVAPIAGILPSRGDREKLGKKPVFHVAGRRDPIVNIIWQNEMINYVKDVNACSKEAIKIDDFVTEYASSDGYPVMTYISNSGHEVPEAAVPLIVSFFKAHELK